MCVCTRLHENFSSGSGNSRRPTYGIFARVGRPSGVDGISFLVSIALTIAVVTLGARAEAQASPQAPTADEAQAREAFQRGRIHYDNGEFDQAARPSKRRTRSRVGTRCSTTSISPTAMPISRKRPQRP